MIGGPLEVEEGEVDHQGHRLNQNQKGLFSFIYKCNCEAFNYQVK